MSDPKSPDDPFDVPEPSFGIPSPPGSTHTPLPSPLRDPGDFDDAFVAAQPSPSPGPEPEPPAPVPPREDPAALARRLVQEAKERAAAQAPKAKEKPKEDPAALARRLAQQAKERAAAQADKPAEKPKEDPAALARRLAQQAKERAAAQPQDAPKPTPAPAAAVPSKRKSAAEMLAEARASAAAASAPATKPAPPPPAPAPQPVTPPTVDPNEAIRALAPNCTILDVRTPASGVALRAVWKAHLARGQATDDLQLIATASALLAALGRVGPEGIAAAEVQLGGERHALWLDRATGAAIATATPAHVYLAGS